MPPGSSQATPFTSTAATTSSTSELCEVAVPSLPGERELIRSNVGAAFGPSVRAGAYPAPKRRGHTRQVTLLLSCRHLRHLLVGSGRIDDEFERVGVLVLLHELQVHDPFRLGHGLVLCETAVDCVEQRGGQFELAIGGEPLDRVQQLCLVDT